MLYGRCISYKTAQYIQKAMLGQSVLFYIIYLPPRDDAAEFDDSGPDLRGIVDDVNLVAWRKGNKAGIILSAIVSKDVKDNEDVTIGFAMKFIYTNTVPALEQREVQTSEIIAPVYITLGTVTKS